MREELGKQIDRQELIDIFKPNEGSLSFYYGRIGNGKTYAATADILGLLRKGKVVYANWHINFNGYDERDSFAWLILGLFGKKRYFKFKAENLRYFSPDDVDIPFLASITDAEVFIDEGQWIFDSYEGTKFSKEKRKLILHTRHLNRSLNLISQRTQAIQVNARGQVNKFYRCVKKISWPVLVFQRTEFQDMKDNDVDEDSDPVSKKLYIARKYVLNAYNSKYLRDGVEKSQDVEFDAFTLTYKEIVRAIYAKLRERLSAKRKIVSSKQLLSRKLPL